ncbi:MAG: PP2C family serine/threonine-protein phosphatase [Planctomycetaceae bacterium]
MTSAPVVQFASRTDVGMRRAANQDSNTVRLCSDYEEWSQCGHLFVVADGMGGHAVGDLASRITIEALPPAYFKKEATSVEHRLRQAIQSANKAINDRARENREFEGMGTTCSVLTLSDRGAIVGHVGDSRVYRVRNGLIEQLTFDHSLQWEMIRLGKATAENVELFHPRNVITRCLGPDPMVQIDIEGPFSVEAGDYFLLCSDGLTNHVSDSEIGQIVASLPPAESSRLLINLANCRGGSDNCTVVVVAVDSYPMTQSGGFQLEGPVKALTAGPPRTSGIAKVIVSGLAVVCLLAGIGLALSNRKLGAAAFIVASLVAWFFGRRMNKGGQGDELTLADLADPPPTSPMIDEADHSSSRSSFRQRSPYRVIEARLSEGLLSHLAEVQSELVQAARDSGWKVDFDELTNLNRQAVSAQQSQKSDRAIKARAKAIDLLMKELYARSRNG